MKAIILCAGYGTRLYPLTKNKPKALLPVGDKTILDLLIDNINEIDEIDEIVLVSNDRFYKQFCEHIKSFVCPKKITVLNDGTTDNATRLGAIGDFKFALDAIDYSGETMVLAGDNWFNFRLKNLVDFYKSNNRANIVFGEDKFDLDTLRSGGVAVLDKDGKVLEMQEKPFIPNSTFAVGPFYIYNEKAVASIDKYLTSGGNPDAPGHYPAWLVKNGHEIRAYDIGKADYQYIDIGTPLVYQELNDKLNNTL